MMRLSKVEIGAYNNLIRSMMTYKQKSIIVSSIA